VITFRRLYLDRFLEAHRAEFRGDVLDIGGEKFDNRSAFTPPKEQAASWRVINIDPATGADIIASAESVPLPDSCADVALMTELLEHVSAPDAVLREAARLLKAGGMIYITMPFLYQVHGDPHDYARWTADMMRARVQEAGFELVSLEPMGGIFAVIYDLIRAHLYRTGTPGALGFRVKLKLLTAGAGLWGWCDRKVTGSQNHITTGWAVIARKR
jgi:SAM-dependent methyltransferase